MAFMRPTINRDAIGETKNGKKKFSWPFQNIIDFGSIVIVTEF